MKNTKQSARRNNSPIKPVLTKEQFADRMARRFSPFIKVNTTRDGFLYFTEAFTA